MSCASSSPPPRPGRRGTAWRLTLWYAAALSLCLGLLSGLAYYLFDQALTSADRQAILDKAREYALAGQRGMAEALVTEIRLQRAIEERAGFYIRVVDPHGRNLVLIVPQELAGLAPAGLERLPAPPPGEWLVLTGDGGRPVLEAACLPLPGGLSLQVGRSPAARLALLAHLRRVLLFAALPALALALAGGWWLAARSLAPLRDLLATVRGIDAGDLAARVPPRVGGGELDELARQFNRMLEKIARLVTGMRQSLDHVAHDLRTPLARLRFTVEAALREPDDPHAQREALMDCAEEGERLTRMLDMLLDVSEAETGILRLAPAPVDLAGLVAEVAELYGFLAEEKGVALDAAGLPSLTAVVDAGRVRQAVANLLDNAVKYTPAGGRVAVGLERTGAEAVISVADSGPGVAPAERERVFERLYRGDKSRGQRGMGLGLSLVAAVAKAHGGRTAVDEAPGGGARFRLWLPLGGATPAQA
ncbi:MAG: HAMP domain-containing sensor histidine kinase [Thermodesulfobacteriota bacterium]